MSWADNIVPSRAQIISNRDLCLTHIDPIARLKQFCKQGKYRYKISWDQFKNGYMMKCEVWHFRGRSRVYLAHETQFVSVLDLDKARRIIAAALLYNIGLGPEENTDNEPLPTPSENTDKPPTGNLGKIGMTKLATQLLSCTSTDDLAETGPKILCNVMGALGDLARSNIPTDDTPTTGETD